MENNQSSHKGTDSTQSHTEHFISLKYQLTKMGQMLSDLNTKKRPLFISQDQPFNPGDFRPNPDLEKA